MDKSKRSTDEIVLMRLLIIMKRSKKGKRIFDHLSCELAAFFAASSPGARSMPGYRRLLFAASGLPSQSTKHVK